MRKVGIHSGRTISEQSRKVMNLPGFSGLQDQGHGRAFLCIHEMFMDCGHGQQRRNGNMVLIHTPVGKDQDIRALPVCLVHLYKQMTDHPFHGRSLIEQCGNP